MFSPDKFSRPVPKTFLELFQILSSICWDIQTRNFKISNPSYLWQWGPTENQKFNPRQPCLWTCQSSVFGSTLHSWLIFVILSRFPLNPERVLWRSSNALRTDSRLLMIQGYTSLHYNYDTYLHIEDIYGAHDIQYRVHILYGRYVGYILLYILKIYRVRMLHMK